MQWSWRFWRGTEDSAAPARSSYSYSPILPVLASMVTGVNGRVSRAEALAVPAVQQGRRMVGKVATLPLAVYRLADNVQVENTLLRQIDPDVPNIVTMAQTVDDLLFEGISWWRVTARDFDGFPVSARHLDHHSVVVRQANGRNTPAPLPSGIDPRGATVYVDGQQVPWSDLIRFDSAAPPLLAVGANAVRRALALDGAAQMYANNPKPMDYFTPADPNDQPTQEEVDDHLAYWRQSRKNHATGFHDSTWVYNQVDAPNPREMQLTELSKQASLDISNSLGVDPEDLGVSTTSRTYANAAERRLDQVNSTLAPYMRAITDRLSMGDVTRRGYVVRFDLDDFLKGDAASRWSMYKTAVEIGAMTVDEVRAEEGLPVLPKTEQPAPVPADDLGSTEVIEEAEPTIAEADGPPAMIFDRRPMTFEVDLAEFNVDIEARTIVGLAVPYGKLAKGVVFAPGALKWANPSRVKLLRDHDSRQPLGHATELTEGSRGLMTKFKVARGPAGDEALILAEDKVLDGLSIGVDFDFAADTTPHPKHKTAVLVHRADLREVSLTAVPAFDDARVVKVTASREGDEMPAEVTEPQAQTAAPATAPEPVNAQFNAFLEWQAAQQAPRETPAVVNPTRPVALSVNEPQPYRFDRGGNFTSGQQYDFASDLRAMADARDAEGTRTEAGQRVMGLMRAAFDIDTADVVDTNPIIQRPDMYVDERAYKYPLWRAINKGAPPNGVTPFRFPKFGSASGLVGPHTQGVEPTGGTFTDTGQTVTPTAISGKAYLTREVWDASGNPAISTLVWNQMVKGYNEGLETAAATFLNTLTAATDISLTGVDEFLAADWDAELVELQFIRGYDFDMFALHKALYKAFAGARGSDGRPLYPMVNPQNTNGQSRTRFTTMDLGGVDGVPSWALSTKSWLFDRSTVHGWATAPTRLEFPGGSDDNTTYQPVAKVGIGIWGYSAFANSDIGGVREVTYSFS